MIRTRPADNHYENIGKYTFYLDHNIRYAGYLVGGNEVQSARPFDNRFPCDRPTFLSKARCFTGVAIGKAELAGALRGDENFFVLDAMNKA